jgi:hypothetical protein
MKVPFSPHPHQHLLLLMFLMAAFLTGMRWNLSVVLICISFVARDGEHFYPCFFLANWTAFFEKVFFNSGAHFNIGSFSCHLVVFVV